MTKRFNRDTDGIDAKIASIYPLERESLTTPEIERAQDDIAAAITATPRRSARPSRWQWLARPRHATLVGAVIIGLGGSVAAAASLLSAHTGRYPTKMGVPVAMSGPGEALNTQAPNFCQVALQVTSDIPFPARYASWRDWVLGFEFQIKHVSANIPCHAGPTAHLPVTTGWLGEWVASSAFCGWAQSWAHDVGSDDPAAAAIDAHAISQALNWLAGGQVGRPAPQRRTGRRLVHRDPNEDAFGWILTYQQAVRAGDRARVERLLAGAQGFGECLNFDEDLSTFLTRHVVTTKSDGSRMLLEHLRSEGI